MSLLKETLEVESHHFKAISKSTMGLKTFSFLNTYNLIDK